jgi:hypothetical protein
MLFQENLGIEGQEVKQKRPRPNNPTRSLEDKIKADLKEWNTIEGIELYKELYNICSQLFNETFNRKLACLNYYIDNEKDNQEYTVMYAEIKDTWELPMKERYKKHKDLLKRVMSNDTTLIYSENSETQTEDEGQLSLFG